MPAGQWVALGCDVYIPSIDGLVVGPSSYTGVGIDLTGPYEGALQIERLEVWEVQP